MQKNRRRFFSSDLTARISDARIVQARVRSIDCFTRSEYNRLLARFLSSTMVEFESGAHAQCVKRDSRAVGRLGASWWRFSRVFLSKTGSRPRASIVGVTSVLNKNRDALSRGVASWRGGDSFRSSIGSGVTAR